MLHPSHAFDDDQCSACLCFVDDPEAIDPCRPEGPRREVHFNARLVLDVSRLPEGAAIAVVALLQSAADVVLNVARAVSKVDAETIGEPRAMVTTYGFPAAKKPAKKRGPFRRPER